MVDWSLRGRGELENEAVIALSYLPFWADSFRDCLGCQWQREAFKVKKNEHPPGCDARFPRGIGENLLFVAPSLHHFSEASPLGNMTHLCTSRHPRILFVSLCQIFCSGSGLAPVEDKLSLDSSVDGILVGDKRRRGKRGARTVEDSAHRSSRSRHLSPLIPVAGGLVKHGQFDSAGLATGRILDAKRRPE